MLRHFRSGKWYHSGGVCSKGIGSVGLVRKIEIGFPEVIGGAGVGIFIEQAAVAPGHEKLGGAGFYFVPQSVVVLVDEADDEDEAALVGEGQELLIISKLLFGGAVDGEFHGGESQPLGRVVGLD